MSLQQDIKTINGTFSTKLDWKCRLWPKKTGFTTERCTDLETAH